MHKFMCHRFIDHAAKRLQSSRQMFSIQILLVLLLAPFHFAHQHLSPPNVSAAHLVAPGGTDAVVLSAHSLSVHGLGAPEAETDGGVLSQDGVKELRIEVNLDKRGEDQRTYDPTWERAELL